MKQKVYLRYQTICKKNVAKFFNNIKSFADLYNINFYSINLPVKKKRFTVLRSPHVNKSSKDQFEVKLYNGFLVLESSNFCNKSIEQLKHCFDHDILVKVSFFFAK